MPMMNKFEYIKSITDARLLANIYNLDLRVQGRSFVTVCPFHDDSKPSLVITDNYKGQGFTFCKCFACGWGGDVVQFAKDIDGNIERLLPTGYDPVNVYEIAQTEHKQKEVKIDSLPFEYVTMRNDTGSDLKTFLCRMFDPSKVDEVFKRYFVGVERGSRNTIFWQIDSVGRVRTGKIMKYNPDTGKRIKEGYDLIDWVHSRLKKKGMIPNDYALKQCLFGEHLLKGNSKPIAIVESEKTAIIASLWNDSVLWLATGGKDGLNDDRLEAVKDRSVILFPDMDAVEYWRMKANALNSRDYHLKLSATEFEGDKTDLADMILSKYTDDTGTESNHDDVGDICPFLIDCECPF